MSGEFGKVIGGYRHRPGAVDVLVVDDEQGIRDVLVFDLGGRGYSVATASGAGQALELLKERRFRLVLTDISMPKIGGIELLNAVKRGWPETAVIVMTGYATTDIAAAAMKCGAYDFIQKPFELDHVAEVVRKALEKAHLEALVAIHQASKAVFGSIKLEAILPVVAELTQEFVGADDSSVMLVRDGRVEVVACAGLGGVARDGVPPARAGAVARRVIAGLEGVIINGPLSSDPRFADLAPLRRVDASIVQPLVVGGSALGVLNANWTKRAAREAPFCAEDLRHLGILASYAAQALANASLVARLPPTP